MRILITGHRGHIGRTVARHLAALGHDVAGFDRLDGLDLLDLSQVKDAAAGCAAVVHLAALPHDTAGSPEQIMATNALGTWHTLLAAEATGAERFIYFSSAQVFGTAGGERLPDYLPVDDAHPRRATRAYGLSKCLAEDMCAAFTERTGIPSLALRPVWVWDAGQYEKISARWRSEPESEWTPYWEFGGFVDIRDVATAAGLALTVPLTGHHRALLCAADIAATQPSLHMAAWLAPSVPVTDADRYRSDPWRALVDCSAAEALLGWRPHYRWSDRELTGHFVTAALLCDAVRMTDEVPADQVDYYRHRAGEYDATAYGDVTAARARIARLVAEMRPAGNVLEIACGTGLWTEALAAWADTVTAIDAAPEAVAIARDRVRSAHVSFMVADVFSWSPDTRFDVIFFSAWLSHVPVSRFAQFWQLLESLLAGNGRVLFIDEHIDERGKEDYVADLDEVVERRLRDGRTFRVIKNFVDPEKLELQLRGLGWDCAVHRDGGDWVYGEATRCSW